MENNYKLDYGFKDASNVYILAIIVPVIVSFFISFVLAFISALTKIEISSLTSNIWIYSLLLLISQGSLLFVAFLYSKFNKINIYSASKLNKKINILQILVLIVAAVASLYLLLPFINFTDSLIRSWGYNNSSELPFKINTWWSYILGLLVMGLLPAVCEEMVFRGVVFNGTKNKYGAKIAVIVSALCFCIFHMSLQQSVYPLLLGIVLASIVYYTGSLRASIFVHFLNNAIVVTTSFISSFYSSGEADETFALTLQNALMSILWLIIGGLVIFGCLMLLKLIKSKQEKTNALETQQNKNDNLLNSDLQQAKDKSELTMFIVFIAISVIFWIIENIQHFK